MSSDAARRHYQSEDLDIVAQVLRFVEEKQEPLSGNDLAVLDQFHVGGLESTKEFAAILGVRPELRVLDAGSGLGGPSRYVAQRYGCHVTGVDLTERFVAVASLLAGLTGMDGMVDYRTGDLLELDFPAGHFDIVYTQHVVMNIRDRAKLYSEIRRVLKPGGTFGFYDVLAADAQAAPHYPVPWADSEETSFLLTAEQTRADMESAGLTPKMWNDVSAEALVWFEQQRQAAASGNAAGMELIMGPRFGLMRKNFFRSLTEKRIRLVMATALAT